MKCFGCKKEVDEDEIKHCRECGVRLCDDCYYDGVQGICEECEWEEDEMY